MDLIWRKSASSVIGRVSDAAFAAGLEIVVAIQPPSVDLSGFYDKGCPIAM
jgi:hypothetical protein